MQTISVGRKLFALCCGAATLLCLAAFCMASFATPPRVAIGAATSKMIAPSAGATGSVRQPDAAARKRLAHDYGKLPLSFETNRGQSAQAVKFLSRGSGYSLFLTPREAVLSLRQPQSKSRREKASPAKSARAAKPTAPAKTAVLRMKLLGANPLPRVSGQEKLPGISNYFIGNDKSKWRSNVAHFGRVKYENVYRGVDQVYYGNGRQLEYDFIVAPGADPKQIRLAFSGTKKMEVNKRGELVLKMNGGRVVQRAPLTYQQVNGKRVKVASRYIVHGRSVGFDVGRYDKSLPLVIDPVLVYSTYLGGSDHDLGTDIAVDAAGNAYVTGYTDSTDFPTTAGAFRATDPSANNQDAFVTKLNANGTALVYSTYLGGSRNTDQASGIAVDANGNAYVTGRTASTNFPTTAGAFQATDPDTRDEDTFVTRLNATGTALVYSTYLGGNDLDRAVGITVDAAGNAYVTGYTRSTNFPTTAGAFQATAPIPRNPNSSQVATDTFVTKLNANGTALVYSTYLGGNDADFVDGIAVDANGNSYVTGSTDSTDFPTTAGAFQATDPDTNPNPAERDAFVTKLNANGTALVYSTYLGSSGDELGQGIAIDAAGSAYVTGVTLSTDFPTTAGAFQATNPSVGNAAAFVTKLNANGTALIYSTYLGGNNEDEGTDIAVDASGNAYVTGRTASTDFPTTPGAFQATDPDVSSADAFVTRLNDTGTALLDSTYLGGNGFEVGDGIAVDANGNSYVTGQTTTTNFPTTPGAFQATAPNPGRFDAFITKLAPAVPVDTTPPTTNATQNPTPNALGFNNSDVTVTLNATDNPGGSGVQSITYSATGAQPIAQTTVAGNTATILINREGRTTITFFATDVAGNREAPKTIVINLDKTMPRTVATQNPPPDANGFNNSDVTVDLNATDNFSGVRDITYSASGAQPIAQTTVAGNAATIRITADGDTTINFFARDNADNVELTQTITVRIRRPPPPPAPPAPPPAADTIAPTSTGTATPAPNVNGFNNSDVTVAVTATDNPGGSGVQSITISAAGVQAVEPTVVPGAAASLVITQDGATTVGFYATDNAGNRGAAQSLTIRLDKTAPVISYSGGGTYLVDATISIGCSATDNFSGIATTNCQNFTAPAYAYDPGTYTLSASATDRADNTGTGTTSFMVQVTYDSLANLTRSFVTAPTPPPGKKKGAPKVNVAKVAQQLVAQLMKAKAAEAKGDARGKARALAAYASQVQAQSGRAITPARAGILLRLVAFL